MLNLSQQEILPKVPLSKADYCRYAIGLKNKVEVYFLALGQMLKKIRDERMYDGIYTDFDEYCADMDFTESRASKLINVYDYFVATLNIPEEKLIHAGGWSVLYELYQLADGKPDQLTFVNATLDTLASPILGGRQKLLRQMKKGVDPIECLHEDAYVIKCCRKCGERMRQDATLESQNTP